VRFVVLPKTRRHADLGLRLQAEGVFKPATAMDIRKPNRVTRSYTQHLVAEPDRVFPLLCPVREADWIEGWEPLCVASESGVAEADCVFVTEGTPGNSIWFITRYAPHSGFIEMLKITPEVTACKLSIQLFATHGGSGAKVTYSHTSLGPAGDEFIAGFTEDYYIGFMRDWEKRLNHYLRTGSASLGSPKQFESVA
jgi:hypothetical protein